MSDSPVSHYLELGSTPSEQRRVSELLLDIGCVALEEKSDGSVLAYAESESSLDEFTRACARMLGEERVRRVPLDANWELAFTDSLQPLELTERLWVVPANKLDGVPVGVSRLLLEPAFAFGFGEHPTTRLIARWLETAVAARERATVLDFGCGTGILALTALLVGAERAVGLDIDPRAIEAARRNAALNALEPRCGFSTDSLLAQCGEFDVVVANVDAQTLVDHAAPLATQMSVGGALALTGFLREDVGRLSDTFERHGVRVHEIATHGEWSLVANWAADD